MIEKIGAGDLDERITINSSIDTDDGHFGATRSFAQLATVWAKVTPLRASETERQGAMRNVEVYMFTIRRRTDLIEAMQIDWNGEFFNIREIRTPRARKLFMDIIAESGVTQ